MRAFFVWLFFLFVGLSAMTFFYMSSPQDLDNISSLIPYSSDSANSLLKKIQQEILTPPPLTGSLTDTAGTLTINGVLAETNKHRIIDKASSLALNKTLNKVAQTKLEDMFAEQYFEHVSPAGIGPADLADGVNYNYIRVGENLALGNFQDDAYLVQAWMDSPGHRENILNRGFSEIGIAVGQGQFDGYNTWLAVQTFGLPVTACPEPNLTLRTAFDDKKSQSDQLATELDAVKQQFDIDTEVIDQLMAEAKELAKQGNAKIKEGNEQIKEGNEMLKDTDSQEQAQLFWDKGETLQQEGEVLLDQAEAKQELVALKQTELKQSQGDYNDQVTTINEIGDSMRSLANQLNEEISAFNSCAERYPN